MTVLHELTSKVITANIGKGWSMSYICSLRCEEETWIVIKTGSVSIMNLGMFRVNQFVFCERIQDGVWASEDQ